MDAPIKRQRADLRIEDRRLSQRVQRFPESVIREMTRVAEAHGAVNLSQGYPDFDPPRALPPRCSFPANPKNKGDRRARRGDPSRRSRWDGCEP